MRADLALASALASAVVVQVWRDLVKWLYYREKMRMYVRIADSVSRCMSDHSRKKV